MKLYTRTGDDGSTGLFGGQRVGKDAARVDAYGTVDEFNACLGLAVAACPAEPPFAALRDVLGTMQSRLFDVGADLATPVGGPHEDKVVRLDRTWVEELERLIDAVDGDNAPLRTFVLPGGTELASRLHLARTVCRRAERRVVALARHDEVTDGIVAYLNRAADLLFAAARAANRHAAVADVPWTPARRATN